MPERRFAAVVFDLDGLLIDSEPIFLEASRRLLKRRGRTLDEPFMHSLMGMPARDVLPRFAARFGLGDSMADLAREVAHEFRASLDGGVVPLMPSAAELIARLVEFGVPLAIATSSQRKYVDEVFAHHGLMEHFHHVLTADDVKHGKPAPDVYLLAAELLSVAPERVAVLEDSPNGIRAAKAAGAACVAVPNARTLVDVLKEADLVATHLGDAALWRFLEL